MRIRGYPSQFLIRHYVVCRADRILLIPRAVPKPCELLESFEVILFLKSLVIRNLQDATLYLTQCRQACARLLRDLLKHFVRCYLLFTVIRHHQMHV